MPVSVQLVLVRHIEQAAFLEIRGEQLHAHRQTVDKASRHGQARQTGEVGGDGVQVFQVLGDQSPVLAPIFQAGFGVVGPRITSTSLKAAMKSFLIRRRIFCALR